MTTMQPKALRTKRVTWLAVLAAIPIVALLIGVVIFNNRQRAAGAEFIRLAGAGDTVDARMAKRFAERTSKDGTAAWSKISTLCSYNAWSEANDLPIIGNGGGPEDLAFDRPLAQEELIADFLSEMRPVIDLIHASADVPKPVWQPMHFDGIQTLLPELQDSRSIARLLQLDALFAIHQGDAERAVAAMRSMRATADVYDWRLFLVGELVNMALNGLLYDTVGRALQADIWSPEQIETLNSLVKHPVPIEEKWRGAFETEELLVLSAMAEQWPNSVLVSNSDKLKWFLHYQTLKTLADAPVGQLSARAEAWDHSGGLEDQRTFGENALNNLLLPSAEAAAVAFESNEYRRRLTFTAVAIKRFKIMNGSWPKSLSDLADVGLSENDWSIPSLGPLGYEVSDDKAVVFTYAVNQDITFVKPTTIRRVPTAIYDEILIR